MGDILAAFPFTLKQKFGTQNKPVDVLSRRATLLTTMSYELTSFKIILDLYATNEDFVGIWVKFHFDDFYTHKGYIFKGNRL